MTIIFHTNGALFPENGAPFFVQFKLFIPPLDKPRVRMPGKTSVVFVDEVDDYFDHGVLFLGAAFGNHEGEGNKGIVGDSLGAVFIIKDAIAVEKP